MEIWKRRGNNTTVAEVIMERTGISIQDLMDPPKVASEDIQGMLAAARIIANNRKPVYIVGDYDVDGITSTAILEMLLTLLRQVVITIIPKRLTDGYGISDTLMAGIKDALVITVDNGIAAPEAIRKVKEAGCTVIVIDHHLPQAELPPADVIVDPHVEPEKNGFVHYCGAGLAYKLAQLLLAGRSGEGVLKTRANIAALAYIGTIADVMPLVGDNRRIVKNGIKIVNDPRYFGMLNPGIQEVFRCWDTPYDEDTIKFQIAPMLNAPGRLHNAGSTSTLKALLCTDEVKAQEYAQKMNEINNNRKQITAEHWAKTEVLLENLQDGEFPILIQDGIPEGLIGIIAGKAAQASHKPAFLFAKCEDGTLKGSGRTFGSYNLAGITALIKDCVLAAGGHEGAMGITVAAAQFDEMKRRIQEHLESQAVDADPALYYDLEIEEDEAATTLAELKKYAPYGEGIEKPVIMLKGFHATSPDDPVPYIFMGTTSDHVKLFGAKLNAVGFGKAKEYSEMGCPTRLDILGELGENTFRGNTTLQITMAHMRPTEKKGGAMF